MFKTRGAGGVVKALEAEIRRLSHELSAALAVNESQRIALAAMEAQNAALSEKVRDLESRLKLNSQNSSKPPSTDGPEVDRAGHRGRGQRTKRLRGGQPGHASTARSPIQPEDADSQEDVVPERCERCDAALTGRDETPIGRPLYEIPPLTIRLTWYWLHRLRCASCGHVTCGRAPAAVRLVRARDVRPRAGCGGQEPVWRPDPRVVGRPGRTLPAEQATGRGIVRDDLRRAAAGEHDLRHGEAHERSAGGARGGGSSPFGALGCRPRRRDELAGSPRGPEAAWGALAGSPRGPEAAWGALARGQEQGLAVARGDRAGCILLDRPAPWRQGHPRHPGR